jgi:two-component system sensor histidine kinase AlgZ
MSILRKNKVVWLHLSFWCVYLSFNLYQITSFQRTRGGFDWERMLTSVSIQLVFTMLITYLNYFYILPRFLKHKSWPKYVVEFIIPLAAVITIRVYVSRILMAVDERSINYFYSSFFIVQATAITLFITFFIAMLRFLEQWFELEARKKEIENEKLTTELNFLKAQINPHFLFNTLNNLYYLAYSKSENTTEVIAKLSQMMRYMIYDSNHSKVLLSKEIEYMENYISLERLRLNNQIPIQFKTEGDIQDVRIAPLILITFLENAFKHGVTNNDTSAWVNIGIKMEGKVCYYTVENSKISSLQNGHAGKSGIGLQNVMRRLELSYPGLFDLKVDNGGDQYSVKLKLALS